VARRLSGAGGRARSALAACLASLALLVPAAGATAPAAGVLVPGRSLGGIELGWTRRQVEQAWGKAYGRCRSCERETLFFNRVAFRPEGAGVEFRRGRVAAVFTLWAPRAWSTSNGLRVGDPEARLTALYGAQPRVECWGYRAVLLPGRGARSVVYVVDGEVWGFALIRERVPTCR
jgi:hypothetical protein